MTITLWGRRNSANVQKALWALEELGLAYEHRRVGGSFGGSKTPDYLAMNPNGLVPTLMDGDLTLWESDAILRYLARTYGQGTIWPDNAAEAALADQWTTWTTSTLFPKFFALFYPQIFTPRAEQDFSGLGEPAAALATTIAILDRALEGRAHLVGDSFTFGEIGPAIFARRALLLPYGAPSAPNIARWLEGMRARPAFARFIDHPMGTCREEWLEIEKEVG